MHLYPPWRLWLLKQSSFTILFYFPYLTALVSPRSIPCVFLQHLKLKLLSLSSLRLGYWIFLVIYILIERDNLHKSWLAIQLHLFQFARRLQLLKPTSFTILVDVPILLLGVPLEQFFWVFSHIYNILSSLHLVLGYSIDSQSFTFYQK